MTSARDSAKAASSWPTLTISTRPALASSGTAAVTARQACRLGDQAIIAELLGSGSGRDGDRSTGRPVSSRVCSAISRAGVVVLGFGTTITSYAGARVVTALEYEPWTWRQEADGTGPDASGAQTGTPCAAHTRWNSARACSAARSRACAARATSPSAGCPPAGTRA